MKEVSIADRRADPRIEVDEEAILHVLHPSSSDEPAWQVKVKVMDISQNGLGLRSAVPLPAGALVYLRIRDTIVAVGEVRYSAQVAGEFYSGVLVTHAAADDPQRQ
jgi:hypothetical protein